MSSTTPPPKHLHPPKHERKQSHWDYHMADASLEELNKWLAEEKERERRACYR